jgi:hypothetical protein
MTKPDPTLDALHTEERESALTFPCTFPIKIMGRTQDGFAQSVADVVCRHAPTSIPGAEMCASKEGNIVVYGDGQRHLGSSSTTCTGNWSRIRW